jgi:hypothetical protein
MSSDFFHWLAKPSSNRYQKSSVLALISRYILSKYPWNGWLAPGSLGTPNKHPYIYIYIYAYIFHKVIEIHHSYPTHRPVIFGLFTTRLWSRRSTPWGSIQVTQVPVLGVGQDGHRNLPSTPPQDVAANGCPENAPRQKWGVWETSKNEDSTHNSMASVTYISTDFCDITSG